jgi:DNA-binding LacI/PurR family transcriptional regulator
MKVIKVQQLGSYAPHQQIKKNILDKIRNGTWKLNEKIPGEVYLSEEYGVSRITVRKALKNLEKEGILQSRQGAGRIVVKSLSEESASRNIGVICTQFGSSYGEVELINELAEQNGYELNLYLLQDLASANSLNQQLKQLTVEKTAGIIILCRDILDREIIEWNRLVPTVAVYHDCNSPDIPSFYINWRWMALEATEKFFDTGFDDQILLLNNKPFFQQVNRMIIDAFKYSHYRRGLQLKSEQIFMLPSERQHNYESKLDVIEPFLSSGKKHGIFSYWNWPLINIISKCTSMQVNIPEQISLIGAVDSEIIQNASIPVTAFSYNRSQLVKEAFETLISLIKKTDSKTTPAIHSEVYGKLICRKTTL